MKQELISKLNELIELLSSDDSELAIGAEECLNDKDLIDFSELTVSAADVLKEALNIVELCEGPTISELDIEELGAVAQALDDSEDPVLRKQASVIDEILISIGANPKAGEAFKKAQDEEIERLRAKYNKKEEPKQENKMAQEAIKAIEEKVKRYMPLEAPLSTRYSPDMPGVMLVRIGDNVWQCPVTKKIYDFANGYTTAKGNKIPGTSVSEQSKLDNAVQDNMQFTSREDALNR